MIINEKGLAKLMEAEFKRGGYHVALDDGETYLWSNDWCVFIPCGLRLRKITGLLAEHFGCIPEDGAYQVYGLKTDGKLEAVVQIEMRGESETAIGFRIPQEWDEGTRTGLSYLGCTLWQTKDKNIILIPSGVYGLLENGASKPTLTGNCLMWQDTEDCRVWCAGTDVRDAQLREEQADALLSVRWF